MFFFSKRPGLVEQAQKLKEGLFSRDSEDDDDDVDDMLESSEPVEEFVENNCICPICACMNTIYERWDKWEPSNQYEELLKKHIEAMN